MTALPTLVGRRRPHAAAPPVRLPSPSVTRRDALLLLLLSAIWGVVVPVHQARRRRRSSPRSSCSAARPRRAHAARACCPGRGGLKPLRGHLLPLVVLGALNNALPFWLLGFAETRLDSGLTAVIQAAAPIFTVLLASRIDRTQRVTGAAARSASAIGFVGVALLVGVQSGGDLVAALAVIGVALCYAASVLFAGRTVRSVPPLQVSIGQLACAALSDRAVRPRPASRRRRRRRRCGSPSSRSACSARGSPTSSTSRSSRAPALAGDPRHLPRARVRARLRRRLPRRGRHGRRARRPRARPRRHRARHRPRAAARRLASPRDQPLLAPAPLARGALGRVVPLHQGRRRRRLLAGGADGGADALAGVVLLAYLAATLGPRPRVDATARGLARGDRARAAQRRAPVLAHRLGRAVHRLGRRRRSRRRRCRSSRS